MDKFTSNELEIIKSNYESQDKNTIKTLIPNHSWSSIMIRARKLGLSRLHLKAVLRSSKISRLLPNTLYNCYWWGFIMADGHLSPRGILKISLSKKDESHVQKIAKYLGVNVNYEIVDCSTHIYSSSEKREFAVMETMDTVNGINLKNKLNIKTKKTYNPPESFDFLITKDELLSFLIGFIDGDGTVSFNKKTNSFYALVMELHGNWYNFLSCLCQKINQEFNLNFKVTKNSKGYTYMYIGKKASYETLKDFILVNELPVLNRKWKIN